MRPTRFDMMNELRSIFGHTDQTDILIDWLQDAWQTYDALIAGVGKERAYQMINAMDRFPDSITPHDLPSYDYTNEQREECLLN